MESFKKNIHLVICGLVAAALFVSFGVGATHPAAQINHTATASATATANR